MKLCQHISIFASEGSHTFSVKQFFQRDVPTFFVDKASLMDAVSTRAPPTPALQFLVGKVIRLYCAHPSERLALFQEGFVPANPLNDPREVLYSIQAEVLLSEFLVSEGRLRQAFYHTDRAIAMVVPRSHIDHEQCLAAFWTVYFLDRMSSAFTNTVVGIHDSCGAGGPGIQTPWSTRATVRIYTGLIRSLVIRLITCGRLSGARVQSTTLYGSPSSGSWCRGYRPNMRTLFRGRKLRRSSTRCLRSDDCLISRVSFFCDGFDGKVDADAGPAEQFQQLTSLISTFIHVLPSVDANPAPDQHTLLIHSMLRVSHLHLHRSFASGLERLGDAIVVARISTLVVGRPLDNVFNVSFLFAVCSRTHAEYRNSRCGCIRPDSCGTSALSRGMRTLRTSDEQATLSSVRWRPPPTIVLSQVIASDLSRCLFHSAHSFAGIHLKNVREYYPQAST